MDRLPYVYAAALAAALLAWRSEGLTVLNGIQWTLSLADRAASSRVLPHPAGPARTWSLKCVGRTPRTREPIADTLPTAGEYIDLEPDRSQAVGPEPAALATAKAVDEKAVLPTVLRDQRLDLVGDVPKGILDADQVGPCLSDL